MAINRVDYGGSTLVDLTADTVTPETLLQGRIAHGADGEPIIGTFDPAGEIFNPAPWKDVEVGTITPTTAISQLAADPSKGTPMGLIISLISKNDVSVSSNSIISASWANNTAESIFSRCVCYYKNATNRTTLSSYPTYSDGSFSLYRSLRAGWTYYYCIIYGN